MRHETFITGLLVSAVILASAAAQTGYEFPDHLDSLINETSPDTPWQQESDMLYPDAQIRVNRDHEKNLKSYPTKSSGYQGKFQRDSIIGYEYIPGEGQVLSHKQYYEYDISGKTILYVFSLWDAHSEAWKNDNKEEYIRDTRGSLILRNIFHWDEHYEAWIHNHKSEYEYDADGMLSVDIHSRWDGIGTWNTTKTEHEYDAHGNTTLITAYALHGEEWVPLNKHEYDFDDKGNRLLYIAYNRDPEKQEWVYHIKDEREYDAYGNIIFSAGYLWNKTGEAWIDQSKAETEYEYDAGGKVISSLRSIWDFNNNKWGSYEKTRYEYDHGGRLTSLIRLSRDAGSEEWINNRKVEYEYNQDGVRTLHAQYDWDPGTENWVNVFHYEYAFDSFGNLTTIYASLTIQGHQSIYTYEYYYSRAFALFFEDIATYVGRVAEIILKTNQLFPQDDITSFGLDFTFDSNSMEYIDYCLDGTLAMDGDMQVTNSENKLQISWTGDNPVSGEGNMIKLRFRVVEEAVNTPVISGAYFNENNVNIGNGRITASYKYGDIDANDHIQAYDAALVLQYSLGMDPIPETDPLPWQSWRFATADVNGDGKISDDDALEILNYSVGLIDVFPSGESNGSAKSTGASITVSYEDNSLIFTPSGNLYGLNVFIRENLEIPGEPVLLIQDILTASDIGEDTYAFGLAAALPLEENRVFMKIPLTVTESRDITLDMFVNTEPVSITVSVYPTSAEAITDEQILIYPSPANNDLFVSGIQVNSLISVYDITGRQVLSVSATSSAEKIDVSPLQTGIYIIKVSNRNTQKVSRFIKH